MALPSGWLGRRRAAGFRGFGYSSMALLLGLAGAPVLGQDAADTAPARKPEKQTYIEEVIVTVSKREESVQDISSAVSAFSGELLKENNIQDYATLADLTPGMITRNEESVTIRGISKSRDGTSPVAFHVNGFIMERRGEPFYDLQAVEVLRGPSGTVYGRNATAGAINARWNAPVDEWGLGADYRASSFDGEQLRGYVNIPVFGEGNPLLLARIAAFKSKHNGYLDNTLAEDADDPYAEDNRFVRLYLTSQLTDGFRLGLRAIWNEVEPAGGGNSVASPSLATRRSGILEKFGAEPLPDDLLIVRSDMFQRFPQGYQRFKRVVGEFNWALPALPWLGEVDVDFMAGQINENNFDITDLDGTEEPIVDVITTPKAQRQNAELRFTSQNDNGIEWIFGAFWYQSDWNRDMHVDARTEEGLGTLFPQVAGLPLPERIFDADVDFIGESRVDESEALFFNLKADFATLISGAPDIQVFAGIRENRDRVHLRTDHEIITATDRDTGITIPFQDKSTDVEGKFEATTGELGAKWFYAEDSMLYLKYAKGYKPGTVQLLAGEEINSVDPEFLEMIEAGWKVSLFDRSLVLNLSAFNYDYTDLQTSKIIITGTKLENAGQATVNGVELEAQWAPTAAFFAQFAVAWLETEFGEFCGRDEELVDQQVQPGCTEEQPHNFEGAELNDAPNLTFTTLMRYTFELGDFGTLTPSLKFAWIDQYMRRPYDNPIDEIDAHTKTDLRLTWESLRQHYRIEVFVENIEDYDDLFADHFSMPDPGAYSLLTVQPPRTVGLKFEASF